MTDTPSGLSRSTLRLLAVAAVGLAASSAQPVLAATAASIGLFLFGWSMASSLAPATGAEHRWAAVAAVAVILGSSISPLPSIPDSIDPMRPLLLALAIGSCAVAFWSGTRLGARRLAVLLGLLLVLVATGALIAAEWESDLGTDIYQAHRAAGAAVLEGQNPYGDAVRFLDGSPFAAEGSVIEGYAYPPVVLYTYGLVGAFTDPRLVSALAWIGVVGWMGWRGSRDERGSGVALGAFLLLSTLSIWGLVWYAAWTEPLSLALFALAVVAWNKHSILAGVLLGLALASKQYFVFLAPLLLLHRDEDWLKRVMVAGGTAMTTLLPALLVDPAAFLTATVGNLADIGFRPDTQSIPGFLGALGAEFTLPTWVWLAVGLLAGAVMGYRSRSDSLFAGRSGLVLGLAFVVGLAFANYWVLVAGLFSVATVLTATVRSSTPEFGPSRKDLTHASPFG